MKRVLIFLGLMIATILSGCLSEREREEVNALEREAKEKMEAFLGEEFGNYKILEYEQYVELGILGDNYISDITEFSVKIDGKKYTFAYCADSDTYWSNYYYDDIFDDLIAKLTNYEILNEAYSHEVKIYGNEIRVLEENLLLHEDENVDDVMDRMHRSDAYSMECSYYFNNKRNFNPTDLGLDCIYADFPYMDLDLYNTAGNVYDPAYVLDTVQYEKVDRDECYISVKYSHSKIASVDGKYYRYDDNFFDVNITPVEYNINNPERTTYSEVNFRREGAAYKIEVEKLADIDFTKIETSFINENGIEVKVIYEDYLNMYMYFEKDQYEDMYLYNSFTKKMDNFIAFEVGSYFEENFEIMYVDEYSFIVALYKRMD